MTKSIIFRKHQTNTLTFVSEGFTSKLFNVQSVIAKFNQLSLFFVWLLSMKQM